MPSPEPDQPDATELELAAILDGFRQELHEGDNPDPGACLGLNPHLAAELAECLQGLAAMKELRLELQQADPSAQVSPQSLGDFQIVREIGRGGMGVVYEALHTRLNRRVAVKVIKAGALADERELEMFRKEALAAASLHHANIVQLFEFGNHDGQPYLVLEFVDGGSLDDRLSGTPIDPYEAAQLMATLAKAIHYAHTRGIIHRDLKPANVLLVLGGEFESHSGDHARQRSHFANPKVTDFGLAKQMHANDGQTQSGAIQGTPSYMAPEQATGGLTTSATDVYALGAILYETLTGRPPFRAATPLDTLLQVRSMEPVPPTRFQPSVPRDLETICLKCLHKEPSQRYSSALELAEDLGRFLRHEPIHARPVGVGGRVWRWCRRNPVVASLLGLAAALAGLVVILLGLRLMDERATREKVLAENVFAATHTANTILATLWKSAEAVDQTANDPELLKRLKEDRNNMQPLPPAQDPASPKFFLSEKRRKLQPYLEHIHARRKSAFHSWHVVDKDGIMVADGPRPSRSVFGVSFQGRDYFIGAMRHVGIVGRARIHVSRAYQSSNDDLFKIVLSALVYDDADGKNPIGVVCATLPTDPKMGFPINNPKDDHTAVLVGRMDPNAVPHLKPAQEEGPAEMMVLVHPAYGELPNFGQGKQAVVFPQAVLPLVPRQHPESKDEFVQIAPTVADANYYARHETFEDPLGKESAKYGGRWLAGFAQVGNTEMVVIVQRRREEWTNSWYGLLLVAVILLAVGLFAAASWRRRHRSRAVPPGAIAPAPTVSFAEAPPRDSSE